MATTLTINGINYSFPETGDETWGDVVTSWATAVSSGLLQKAGGSFILTAELDFGTNFGIKLPYIKDDAATIASAGFLRFPNNRSADGDLAWRNNADTNDVWLYTDANDDLIFNQNGTPINISAASSGNVTGPGSSTDNAIARFDSTTGQLLQNSGVLINDTDDMSAIRDLTLTRNLIIPSSIRPDDLSIAFEFEGPSGGASTAKQCLAKVINQGGIINSQSLSTADFVEADIQSVVSKFGTYSFGMGGSAVLGFPAVNCDRNKGTHSLWLRNLAASQGICVNPLLGIELRLDASGFLETEITEAISSSESAKNTLTVTGNVARDIDTTFRNLIFQWRTNDEAGASTDLLKLYYEGAEETGATQLTGQDIDVNSGAGGIWFWGAKRLVVPWDHFYAASDLPSAHSDAWTKTGTFGESVSNGVLNFTISSLTGNQFYTKTNNIDLSQFTMYAKIQINSMTQRSALSDDMFYIQIRDTGVDRGISLNFTTQSVAVSHMSGAGSIGGGNVKAEIYLDTTQPHEYWLESTGAGGADTDITWTLYIDGLAVATATNTNTDTSSTQIQFGGSNGGTYSVDVDMELIAYHDDGAFPPISLSSGGSLDSVGVISEVIDDELITALQSNAITDVFGKVPSYGITLPPTVIYDRDATLTTASNNYAQIGDNIFYLPGDGVSKMDMRGSMSIFGTGGNAITHVVWDVNGDLSGLSATTAASIAFPDAKAQADLNVPRQICPLRQMVLPVGLNTITPMWAVEGNTANDEEREHLFEFSIAKDEHIN